MAMTTKQKKNSNKPSDTGVSEIIKTEKQVNQSNRRANKKDQKKCYSCLIGGKSQDSSSQELAPPVNQGEPVQLTENGRGVGNHPNQNDRPNRRNHNQNAEQNDDVFQGHIPMSGKYHEEGQREFI